MKLEEISPEILEKIRTYRWDRIIEKHEGPETWNYLLDSKSVEFLQIDGYVVLLPIDKEHHPNMSILRCIVSEDHRVLPAKLLDMSPVMRCPSWTPFAVLGVYWASFRLHLRHCLPIES